jgi:ABC-type dipeptide/oligopeptide/nickel transport system ATPase component
MACCVMHDVPLAFFSHVQTFPLMSQVEFKIQSKQCSVIVAVVGHRGHGKSCFYDIQLLQVC